LGKFFFKALDILSIYEGEKSFLMAHLRFFFCPILVFIFALGCGKPVKEKKFFQRLKCCFSHSPKLKQYNNQRLRGEFGNSEFVRL